MIPKRFTLGRRKWIVRIVSTAQLAQHLQRNNLSLHDAYDEAKNIHGLCDDQRGRILLNKDLDKTEAALRETFWHEFAHALKFANGERDHDEAEVERIGQALLQFEETRDDRHHGTDT